MARSARADAHGHSHSHAHAHGEPSSSPAAPSTASRVFAFRADHETVAVLSAMPNASDFIRKAIARSMEEPCPVCQGRGVVTPGFRRQMEQQGGHVLLRRCSCCESEYPAPCDARPLAGVDRLRHELAVRRGEDLCAECFERAAPCTRCKRAWPAHGVSDFVAHWQANHCGRALVTRSHAGASRADGHARGRKRK